jgi:UDP-N-acetyl-D-galactosamine dehydrogenase
MENSIFNLLRKKISSNKIVISVVGMGYVGLPLALLFGRKFKTIGIDISEKKIIRLKKRKYENNQCTVNDFK